MARFKNKVADVVVENHPEGYTGPEWITFIKYINNREKLVVVDSMDKNYLWGYNFDDLKGVEQNIFILTMNDYWNAELYGEPLRHRVAINEWFVEKDLIEIFGPKLVGYSTADILRLVGPVREANKLSERANTKRRKRISVKVK